MSIVNARDTYAPTVAKGGVMSSLFTGRKVEVLSGFSADPTKRRGYRRLFDGKRQTRPGAYSPRTTRVSTMAGMPSHVGTQMVIGAMEQMKADVASKGVAGSRVGYDRARPRISGLSSRVVMSNTPAYQIVEMAFARTGLPVIHSRFTSEQHELPAGMNRYSPVPGYTHVPLGSIVAPERPVGCLPGSPGCFRGDVTGARKPWWVTQNEGQLGSPVLDQSMAPLPGAASRTGSPLSPPSEDALIRFPVNHPGTQHSLSTTGGPSYGPQPRYPHWTSPLGHAGSATRPAAEEPIPSGQDAAFRARDARARSRAGLVVGVAAAALLYAAAGRRRRRS